MRKRLSAALVVALTAIVLAPAAQAGPFADEMAKCFVRSTSDADKTELVKWIFSLAALHPAVGSISSVSEEQRTDLNRKTARLLERLLTETCGTESREAYTNEGPAVLSAAFQTLAQVASVGLFSDPAVVGGSAGLQKEFDGPKIQKFLEAK